jgi:two-component sensor histidine kinase
MIRKMNKQGCTPPPLEGERLIPRIDPNKLLVQEANHRIKNSLQLVAAMLHLQARRHLDMPVLHDTLIGACHRVRAVAQLHDRLHRDAGDELDAGAYLHDLCETLARSFGLSTSHSIVVEAPYVPLRADQILSLGLIVIELVTNAVKHDLAPASICEIRVVLAPAQHNTLRLLVADTGPGIPDTVLSGATAGTGMRLVRQLARTLGGHLEIDGTPPGSRFTVRFAVEPGTGHRRNTARSSVSSV